MARTTQGDIYSVVSGQAPERITQGDIYSVVSGQAPERITQAAVLSVVDIFAPPRVSQCDIYSVVEGQAPVRVTTAGVYFVFDSPPPPVIGSIDLELVFSGQAEKEKTYNALIETISPAASMALESFTSLAWKYYGGLIALNGNPVFITNGEIPLIGNSVNYLQIDSSGVLDTSTTGFAHGAVPLYIVQAGASGVLSYSDQRHRPINSTRTMSLAITAGNNILDAFAAQASLIVLHGALSGPASVLFPDQWIGVLTIINKTSGGYDTTLKTVSGTGFLLSPNRAVRAYSNGVDFRPATPPTLT